MQIKERMKELGLTQESLAEKMGVTQGAIGHYIRAGSQRGIPQNRRKELEKLLQFPPGTLTYSEEREVLHDFEQYIPSTRIVLPFLEVYEVANWVKHGNLPPSPKKTEVIVFGKNLSDKCFVMPVIGDSMALGHKISLKDGDNIVVDPDILPKSGYIVVAEIGGKDVKIRQYQQDGSQQFLKAFDSQYPIIEITDNITILGVAIHVVGSLIPKEN